MIFKYTSVLALFFFYNMGISQSIDTSGMEGILYSDEGWVSISTTKGKISGINRLSKGDKESKIYVAPV